MQLQYVCSVVLEATPLRRGRQIVQIVLLVATRQQEALYAQYAVQGATSPLWLELQVARPVALGDTPLV